MSFPVFFRIAAFILCTFNKEDVSMDFKWLNEGQVKTNGDKIEIFAPAQSDFFFNNGAIGEEGITP